ncbi:hypothetical protein VL15_37375 [Burkholderia cepacia]|uniref:Uncharacterized protein n=1 Tax=Burkholderia cepacia TaxID=292 RepID=A0A0J5W3Z5_BURCE|nr:hypothetical protein VL15_37375 [Burkholderia cepacia]
MKLTSLPADAVDAVDADVTDAADEVDVVDVAAAFSGAMWSISMEDAALARRDRCASRTVLSTRRRLPVPSAGSDSGGRAPDADASVEPRGFSAGNSVDARWEAALDGLAARFGGVLPGAASG